MVTSIFTSQLKVMAFTVFGLSIILSLSLLFLQNPSVVEAKFWNEWQSIMIVILAITIVTFGCLPLLKMKTICIEGHQITFQNYVFGSNIRKVRVQDFDYYQTIQEESENGMFEATWLIKNGKLMNAFSTYQYSNYNALRSALNLKYKGQLDISPIKQLCCRFGLKI